LSNRLLKEKVDSRTPDHGIGSPGFWPGELKIDSSKNVLIDLLICMVLNPKFVKHPTDLEVTDTDAGKH